MDTKEKNQEETVINIGDVLRTLWKNIILIAIVTVCFLIGGSVYTFGIVDEEYSSSATFVVAIEDYSSGSENGEYDYTNALRLITTVASLVTEDVVVDDVAAEYNLSSNKLKSMISVSYSTSSFLISVSVQSTDRTLSMNLANAVVDQLIEVANNSDGFGFIANTITKTSSAKEGTYASPNKTLYILVSIVIGVAVGCVIVFIKEFASTKFKTKKDIETILDERIVGYFVDNKQKKTVKEVFTPKDKRQHLKRDYDLLQAGLRNYEPYNALLTNIKYADLENPYRVIMITSSHERELKSTILANLAGCIAYNKKRVLLVDLDMRKPVQHKFFHVSKKKGLLEYLEGSCTKENIVKHTTLGVDVVTGGKEIQNPVVIIENSKLKGLIETFKEEYDYILIDAPPVLLCSDAGQISKLCDGVLFNVAMNDVKKKEASAALESLRSVGAKIIGVNVSKGVADDYNSGYYYHYYSYYGGTRGDKEGALAEAAVADSAVIAEEPKSRTDKTKK